MADVSVVGSISELARVMRCDPYSLRQGIANRTVPATFEGQGRYRLDAATVRRGVDREGRPPQAEPQPAPSSSLVDAVRSEPRGTPQFEAAVANELARRQALLAEGVDWTQAQPRYIPPQPFDRGRVLL